MGERFVAATQGEAQGHFTGFATPALLFQALTKLERRARQRRLHRGAQRVRRKAWIAPPKGALKMKKTRSITELAGSVKSSVTGVSVDDMKAWRDSQPVKARRRKIG
jgi:hypothetical protein